jgi:hypothetical protein
MSIAATGGGKRRAPPHKKLDHGQRARILDLLTADVPRPEIAQRVAVSLHQVNSVAKRRAVRAGGGLCRGCGFVVRNPARCAICIAHRWAGPELAEPPSEQPLRAPAPTRAAPGSLEKIEVLARRLREGQALYHPDDAPLVPASVQRARSWRAG